MTSKELFYDKKTGFDQLTADDKQAIQHYAAGYKTFLDECKTERDAVAELARLAESKGFHAWTRDDTLQPGDRIYQINRGKSILLAVIGSQSLAQGIRLTAAHLEQCRRVVHNQRAISMIGVMLERFQRRGANIGESQRIEPL